MTILDALGKIKPKRAAMLVGLVVLAALVGSFAVHGSWFATGILVGVVGYLAVFCEILDVFSHAVIEDGVETYRLAKIAQQQWEFEHAAAMHFFEVAGDAVDELSLHNPDVAKAYVARIRDISGERRLRLREMADV